MANATMRLGQLAARTVSKKKETKEKLEACYHSLQKPAQFNGRVRISTPYKANADMADQLPTERTDVQANAMDILKQMINVHGLLATDVRAQDIGNTQAKADVKLRDGTVLIKDLSIYSIMGGIQMWTDILAGISKLPVPSTDVTWVYDQTRNMLTSKDDVIQQRTSNVLRALVLAEATDRHPAQTQSYTVQEPVGEYRGTAFTTAVPAIVKKELEDLANEMLAAFKEARETANSTTQLEAVNPNAVPPDVAYFLNRLKESWDKFVAANSVTASK